MSARNAMRKSQRAFAAAVGVHKSTIISWEKGKTQPSGGDLDALLRVIGWYPDQTRPQQGVRDAPPATGLGRKSLRALDADGVLYAVSAMQRTLAELIEAAQAARDEEAALAHEAAVKAAVADDASSRARSPEATPATSAPARRRAGD